MLNELMLNDTPYWGNFEQLSRQYVRSASISRHYSKPGAGE